MAVCLTCVTLVVLQAAPRPAEVLTDIRVLLEAPQTPERLQRIDVLLQQINHLEGSKPDPTILDARFGMHAQMLERYRAAGDLAGVRRHAEWLVASEHLVHAFQEPATPDGRPRAREARDTGYIREVRRRHGAAFLAARLDVARAALADGDRAGALRWLERAERCLADVPGAVNALRAERDRISKPGVVH